jgi:phage gp36-like protein
MYLSVKEMELVLEAHVIDQIVDDNRMIVAEAVKDAISEVESYLAVRYDTHKIFAAKGRNRNRDILRRVKIITVWNLITRSNAEVLYDIWERRYHNVVAYLEKIARPGFPSPDLPLLTDDFGEPVGKLQAGSRPKFEHSF